MIFSEPTYARTSLAVDPSPPPAINIDFGFEFELGILEKGLCLKNVQKPVFNITRESRLLSGRGLVKNAADTVITNKNGTVTCPFDFLATPELLLEHLAMVTNTYNADGSNVYTVEVDGSNNSDSVGGTISGKLPHTVNLAYTTGVAASGITIAGNTVSDLSISGDYGSSGGNLTMSGNYFSGFANAPSVGSTGSHLEQTYDGTWVYPDEGSFFNIGSLSTKQLDCDSTSNTQDMILKSFNVEGILHFSSLLASLKSKIEVVVTFLAILELVRMRKVLIIQNEIFGELVIQKIEAEA